MRQNEIAVISVTRNGRDLGRRLAGLLPGCSSFVLQKVAEREKDGVTFEPPLSDLIARIWGRYRALVFIMATGIVVRVIAPLIKDKHSDPAVLVLDEKGSHVISFLSGHLGGANALTQEIAEKIGADPVITTATDLSGLPAVELWAEEMGLVIENAEAVKGINAGLVNGKRVGLFLQEERWLTSDEEVWGPCEMLQSLSHSDCPTRIVVSNRRIDGVVPDQKTLFLRPKNLVLGIGCNRGTTQAEIRDFVTELLERKGLALQSVARVATIDVKRDEAGLIDFAAGLGVPLIFYHRDELNAMPDGSGPSASVQKAIGVKGVCEQAAMKGAGVDSLVIPKAISGNVTAAVAEAAGLSILSV